MYNERVLQPFAAASPNLIKMNTSTESPPTTKPLHPASQPSTPNNYGNRRNQPQSSPISSDDEFDETPRRSRLPLNAKDEAHDINSPDQVQLPIRSKYSPLLPSTTRSQTSMSTTYSPPMQRAYSSPGVDSSGRFINPLHATPRRPSSPLSSGRRRSPLRSSFEELYPASYSGLNIEPNIPEHAELEIVTPVTPEDGLGPLANFSSYSNTFPRTRRRPTSPLHQSASAPSLHARAASPQRLGGASPALSASKLVNEPYPMYSYSSTSSMPSTPTSFRSRSPSISSLETIEDTPDAEEAAMQEDEDLKVRGEDSESTTDGRRKSLDLRASSLRSNKERKRWSVCGAERRADFSLEVIEE